MENMQFESLTIRRNPVYGYSIKDINEGKLSGQLEFMNDSVKVGVKLNEAQARRILSIVADQVVENAGNAAQCLKAEMPKLIEPPVVTVVKVLKVVK